MQKRVLASLCGCYVMISCGSLTWGVPTYTSEFVDGTQEYDFNDFVFSIPKSWSESLSVMGNNRKFEDAYSDINKEGECS